MDGKEVVDWDFYHTYKVKTRLNILLNRVAAA